ncbi:O-Methyltransferase involved in polyketide biosynthesis [Labilithrix luteola]|uniref:S-adenosyl-L-methionine-dependent methyltransferase n=1 Tax=Labilithrix luteola TaxID=1391654 RepID=A0A0K1PN74_9BACT|nr:O-Methyltransferase involved in polyketide biosynthesis [Labilithrix luteola]
MDEAIQRGSVAQVVVLGAGLDTRSARLARPGVRFFEVDHPATQGYKRAALEAVPGYPRDASVFVPCDFERDDFAMALKGAGFQTDLATIVIWEGVIPYLTEDAVRSTFRVLASMLAPESRVYFDYVDHARGADGVADFAGEAGEPFLFKTPDISPLVCGEGFQKVDSLLMTSAQRARTGQDAVNAPFFARWYLAEAVR